MPLDFPKIPEPVFTLPPSTPADGASILPGSLQQAFSAALRSRYAGQTAAGQIAGQTAGQTAGRNITGSPLPALLTASLIASPSLSPSLSPAAVLLDIISAKPPREPESPPREKHMAENRRKTGQQQIEQTYQTQIDRKLLNQSETRNQDRTTAYEQQIGHPHRSERTLFSGDHRGGGPPNSAAGSGKTAQIPLLNDIPIPGIFTQKNVPPHAVSPSVLPSPMSPPVSGAISGAAAVNLSDSLPAAVSSSAAAEAAALPKTPAADARIFSVFTLSGKWGAAVEKKTVEKKTLGKKVTESDDEQDEPDEHKETGDSARVKKYPFADLTAVFTANTRPLRRLFSPNSAASSASSIPPKPSLNLPQHLLQHTPPHSPPYLPEDRNSAAPSEPTASSEPAVLSEPATEPNGVSDPAPDTVSAENFAENLADKLSDNLFVAAGQSGSAEYEAAEYNVTAHDAAGSDTEDGDAEDGGRRQYLQRIAAACEHAVRNAPVRMKINLDCLGTLSLRFFTKANRLEMSFDPENESAADFLRQNLHELHTVLAAQTIAAKIVIEELMLAGASTRFLPQSHKVK